MSTSTTAADVDLSSVHLGAEGAREVADALDVDEWAWEHQAAHPADQNIVVEGDPDSTEGSWGRR